MLEATTRTSIAIALSAFIACGCTTIDEHKNLDADPGRTVSGSSQFSRNFALGANRSEHWTRIRLITPSDAQECRISNHSVFESRGPEMEGKPNADNEIMLTVSSNAKVAEFECRTPTGKIKRRIEAVPYEIKSRGKTIHTAQVLPPLIHMDPTRPNAAQTWKAQIAQLCPTISERATEFPCKPGMSEKLQAADLQPTP